MAALNDGVGPEFSPCEILEDGFTIGAIVELVGPGMLDPGDALEMYVGHYLPLTSGEELLTYCSTLGSPFILIQLSHLDGVVTETSAELTLVSGEITVGDPLPTPFSRGDCNVDGDYGIADVVFALDALFLGGGQPICLPSCDLDADEVFDIADPIFALLNLYQGGPDSPFPGPDGCELAFDGPCGFDSCP